MSNSFFSKAALLFISLAFFETVLIFGQDDFEEGAFLADQGLPDEAVTSYLRFLFLNPGSAKESEACSRIAGCYLKLGEGEKALQYAALALPKAKSEGERRERAFFKTELLLAEGRYSEAWKELEALDRLALERPERVRCRFFQGVLLTYLRQWDEAARSFREYFALSDAYPPATASRVLKLLSFGAQTRYLDPAAAQALSYILPGSGQIYAGDLGQGLNSLLVTGAAGGLAAWAIASGDYLDAAAAVYFIFQRFFFGSPFHAGRIAKERNEERKNMITRAVLELLSQ